MLKGIIINGEIKFVEVNEIGYENYELCDFTDLLWYCCTIGDVVEGEWILIKDEVIKIENEDITRVKIGS